MNNGLVSKQSKFPVAETMDRLEAAVKDYGANVCKRTLVACIAALGLVGQSFIDRANAQVLHTYGNSLGHEVVNVIAVSASKLRPLAARIHHRSRFEPIGRETRSGNRDHRQLSGN